MTTPTTDTDPRAVLAEGEYACLNCGVAVRSPSDLEVVTIPVTGQYVAQVTLTRCADCHELADTARALLDRTTATHNRIEGALCGLAALGKSLPDPETITRNELEMLLRRLSRPGGAARWRSPAVTRRCSPEPWAHVSDEVRAELRTEYAAVMAERMAEGAPTVALAPPPTDGAGAVPVTCGCLLCGVRSLYRSAAEVVRLGGRIAAQHEVWRPLTASPDSLGGRGPVAVTGHLCPHCADARDLVGSVGPTLRERAFMDHLRRTGRDDEAETLRFRLSVDLRPKIPAWCVTGAAPSVTPWAHIATPRP